MGGDSADLEKFKEIVKAYETLSDAKKRQIYDLSIQDSRFSQDAYDAGQTSNFVNDPNVKFYHNK